MRLQPIRNPVKALLVAAIETDLDDGQIAFELWQSLVRLENAGVIRDRWVTLKRLTASPEVGSGLRRELFLAAGLNLAGVLH